MFCPNCGTNVPEDQAFCSNCGTKTAPAAPAQAPQAPAAKASVSIKEMISKDGVFALRVAVVALALLSIILIFSKGIAVHYDGGDYSTIFEWDYFFKQCDSSKALPITLQVISVVLVLGAAASVVLPLFMPQLSKIKIYNLIPAAVAAFNLLLFVIMVIVALAIFDGNSYVGAHPASASWFYIADLIAMIPVSFKMFKGTK